MTNRELGLESERPAHSAFRHDDECAILANRNAICEEEVVHDHGGLFGGGVVLNEAARVVGFHQAVDKLPALPVSAAVGEVQIALIVEV